jgi:hypothetical protein
MPKIAPSWARDYQIDASPESGGDAEIEWSAEIGEVKAVHGDHTPTNWIVAIEQVDPLALDSDEPRKPGLPGVFLGGETAWVCCTEVLPWSA